MNQFWHRRVCEAVMFVAGMIIALYYWTFFTGNNGVGLLVSSTAVIISAVAFFLGVVAYLWTSEKQILPSAFFMYLTLMVIAGSVIVTSQGLSSPFISLWIITAIFAGVFGIWGIGAMFIASSWYLVLSLTQGTVSQQIIVTTVIAGWLPLAASFMIWHNKRTRDESKDRSFRNLANELSEVANKAEVVINAIADGVVAVDNQGIIQLINPAAQEITGWGKQDATKLSYKSVLKLSDKNDAELTNATDPVQTMLATNKETSTNDLSLTTSSGKKILVSIIVSPVGQIGSGAIIVFRDITKQKKEEREQAEFISTASHEMRTPVASIEGYLGLALNPNTAQIDEKARDFIMKAHDSAQHLGRLFQDLLDVSRADDGRLSNNPQIVDVVQFAHDISQGLRPQAEAKGLRFLYKPIPDDNIASERRLTPVFYAHVDNDHLREVISNLIENAIKYTLTGDVIVDVGGDAEHITISIKDSGVGIPAEDIGHLFQKFYRVDNTATREIGGTGLGLYLCRRLVEIMSGRIWVESEYKKGSTFFVELPRTEHEKAMQLIEESAREETKQYPSITPDSTGLPLAAPQEEVVPQTIAQTQPITPQVPPETPDSPAITMTAPAGPTTPAPITTPVSNVSLADIERNPSQYTAQVRPQTVNIPSRDADSAQNKP